MSRRVEDGRGEHHASPSLTLHKLVKERVGPENFTLGTPHLQGVPQVSRTPGRRGRRWPAPRRRRRRRGGGRKEGGQSCATARTPSLLCQELSNQRWRSGSGSSSVVHQNINNLSEKQNLFWLMEDKDRARTTTTTKKSTTSCKMTEMLVVRLDDRI